MAAGRPKAEVNRQQLEFLYSMSFSWNDIAGILVVSIKTAQRKAEDWGIDTYTAISDMELQQMVREFKVEFSNSGEAILKGYLESKGVHLQMRRIRNAIWSVVGHPPSLTMVYHHVYDLILVVRMCVCGDSWKRYEVKDVVHTLLEVALTTQELNTSGEMYTAQ